MTRKEHPKYSWSDAKSALSDFDRENLVALIVEAVLALRCQNGSRSGKRLLELTQSSEGIGWGYHDAICDEYDDAFPGND